eukprot:1160380-Pelagomonas_calceolata.AAC.3
MAIKPMIRLFRRLPNSLPSYTNLHDHASVILRGMHMGLQLHCINERRSIVLIGSEGTFQRGMGAQGA